MTDERKKEETTNWKAARGIGSYVLAIAFAFLIHIKFGYVMLFVSCVIWFLAELKLYMRSDEHGSDIEESLHRLEELVGQIPKMQSGKRQGS